MKHRINYKKSVKNDYLLGLGLLSPFVGIIVLAFGIFISKNIDYKEVQSSSFPHILKIPYFYTIFILSLFIVLGLIVFVKRIKYIKSFENEYKTVTANVIQLSFHSDRCSLDLEFELRGKLCKKHFAFFANKQTRKVLMSPEIKLLVKDENPKKVLISDFYFD